MYTIEDKKTALFFYFRQQEVPGGEEFQTVKHSVGSYLAWWSTTNDPSIIPVVILNRKSLLDIAQRGIF